MLEQKGKLWDYEVVEPGQQGPPTVVTLTAEHIFQYALLAQNPDPRFQGPSGAALLIAMPTMVLSYAPLMREAIAESRFYWSPDQ